MDDQSRLLNAFLKLPDNLSLEKAEVLYITKQTLRFGDDVYQFKNITGFGVGQIKVMIPFSLIIIVFIFGVIISSWLSRQWGNVTIIISCLAAIFSFIQPKQYGLQIYLNSGDKKLFVTSDTKWLERAVSRLYDFMENAPEGSSMTIEIGGNIQGNIIQGSNVEGRNH
ncbi:MAG: DUF6232 family protein [Coleofasciculus sp. G1-WW12-02]|uniref:DUF6232 family protein n=1 Tax=Coleofasciculus sp. G1-WW12-02 TaxID=3068483 RepID=UPI0032FFF982